MVRSLRGWILVFAVAGAISALANFGGMNAYMQQILFYIAINVVLATSLNLVNGFCGQFSLGHAGFMAVGAYTSAVIALRWQPFAGAIEFLNYPIYAIC